MRYEKRDLESRYPYIPIKGTAQYHVEPVDKEGNLEFTWLKREYNRC